MGIDTLCLNNTGYVPIESVSSVTIPAGNNPGLPYPAFDGNYATYILYAGNDFVTTSTEANGATHFYEGGIQWDISELANITAINMSFNNNTYETASDRFNLNLTYDSAITINSVTLYYDSVAKTTSTTKNATFSNSSAIFDLPSSGYKYFYWNVLYQNSSGSQSTNISNYQYIKPINLTNCKSGVQYINFTFKDSISLLNINASVSASTFSFYLGNGNVRKNNSFSNSSNNNQNYTFCFAPQDRSVHTSINFTYSLLSYGQYEYVDTLFLTNTTTEKTLYLVPTASGSYVSFQVINNARQPISGALVTVVSALGETYSGSTDSSGTVTFLLNPLISYTVTASKSGLTNSYTITPSLTSYTITLGITESSNITDYSKGISFVIYPSEHSLINSTVYAFNFTLNSTYYELDGFGFYLNASGKSNVTSSTSTNGGNLSAYLNTINNDTIIMNYYWIINGTYFNGSVHWIVSSEEYKTFSLKNFVDDLKSYVNTGIFGLDKFGLNVLVFLLIFVFTGIISFKFGITSPAPILLLITALVALFDVGFGLIDNPIGAVPHFITILCSLISIALLIQEASR